MASVSSSSWDDAWAFSACQRKQGEQRVEQERLPMNRMALANIYDTSVLLEERTNHKKHWTEKWPFHAFEFSNSGGARNFWAVGSERPMAAILRGPWQPTPPPVFKNFPLGIRGLKVFS